MLRGQDGADPGTELGVQLTDANRADLALCRCPLAVDGGCCEDIPIGIITTRDRPGKQKQELRFSRRCRCRADLRSLAMPESSRTLKK